MTHSSRAAIVAARLLLLLAAAAALALALRAARPAAAPAAHYVCPMHPEATSASPADCPICGMALELETKQQPGSKTAAPAAAADPAGESFMLPAHLPEPTKYGWGAARLRTVAGMIRAAAWVEGSGSIIARIDARQAAGLAPGARGRFVPAGETPPNAGGLEVRVIDVTPPAARAEARTTARLELVSRGSSLRPMQTGWVELSAPDRAVLTIPASAVLESPEGPFVFTGTPRSRTFSRRPVELGTVVRGSAVIESGLAEGEQVLTTGAFMLEVERRRQAPPPGAGGKQP